MYMCIYIYIERERDVCIHRLGFARLREAAAGIGALGVARRLPEQAAGRDQPNFPSLASRMGSGIGMVDDITNHVIER